MSEWISVQDVLRERELTPAQRFTRQQVARREAERLERLARFFERHPEARRTDGEK